MSSMGAPNGALSAGRAATPGLLLEDPRLREASAQNVVAILERTCWRLAAQTRINAERQPGRR